MVMTPRGLALCLSVVVGCSDDTDTSFVDADTRGDASNDGSELDARCDSLPSGPLTRFAGNPFLMNGPQSYDNLKTGPRVVLEFGPNDYRMWYEAVSNNGITSVAYATSSDGLIWTKQGVVMPPTLPWEESETSPGSIVRTNGELVLYYHAGGYTASGMGGTRLGNALVGRATSSDGVTWTKRADPVVALGPSGSFDSDQVAEPHVLAVDGGFRMYYTGRRSGTTDNAWGVASSTDGITWTKDPRNPILDGAQWGNAWGGAVFHEGSVWHLWRAIHAGQTSSLRYMSSADGIDWVEGPSGTVLAQSTDPGAADNGLVGDSVSGYRTGAEYRIMYTGYNDNLFGSQGRFEGICMAAISSPCP
jgi:predicted GH43/DUF377 family glycosyl hydrolase